MTTSEPWEGTGEAPGAAHGAQGFILPHGTAALGSF